MEINEVSVGGRGRGQEPRSRGVGSLWEAGEERIESGILKVAGTRKK